jgi:ATP-dependent protease Clp ATPase subunit
LRRLPPPICAEVCIFGSFQGLHRPHCTEPNPIIQERHACPDFGGQGQSILSQAVPDDLVEYGLLPEVVGRIRDIVVMRDLTAADLRRILMETPNGPLAVAQRVAEREGFRFVLSDELAAAVVSEAMSRGLGVRSLHSILSRVTERAF